MPASGTDPEYGSLATVGQRYGYSADTIELLVARGLLTAYRLAGTGHRRVRYADVEALLVPEKEIA
ncbi:hypothetical protein ACFVDI_14180 [Nocardioides sp. NPDC057767]|uniref:hypothetical protein n=1 Tax=unclassified Nocardioides TaxID=2615069 RepID=UPI00366B404D